MEGACNGLAKATDVAKGWEPILCSEAGCKKQGMMAEKKTHEGVAKDGKKHIKHKRGLEPGTECFPPDTVHH